MPVNITTRAGKGSPLTTPEVDANFTNLARAAEAADASAAAARSAADNAAADAANAAAAGAAARDDAAAALAGLADKQDKLIAGSNIAIGADGRTISTSAAPGGAVMDADAQNKGVLKLADPLGGSAEAPTVFGLASTAAFQTLLATRQAANPVLTDLATRTIGVGSASSIPTLADVDTRFARIFSGRMPDAADGKDGQFGILNAPGYPAVLIRKVDGAWSAVSESFTFAQMRAIPGPVAGMTVMVTTIDWGNGISYGTDSLWRYTGTAWKPLYRCTIFKTSADTLPVTNTQASYQPSLVLIPPVGLFDVGRHVFIETRLRTVVDGTPTASPKLYAAGSMLANSYANVDRQYHGQIYLWTRTADKLRAGGGADSWDVTAAGPASVEQPTSFDGKTATLELGVTFSAVGGDTTVCFEDVLMELVP